jgi:hypothetical protein
MAPSAEQIEEICRQTEQAARDAAAWVDDNPEAVRNEADGLKHEVRRWRITARRLGDAAKRPMCVGVFGASQAGKSYLISALARSGTKPLTTTIGGHQLDYLAKINPEGDKEATGLVTRFTIGALPATERAPVSLRLLTEADLLKILGNSFLSDADHSMIEEPSAEAITERLEAARTRVQPQPVDASLDSDEVFDVQDYLERSFRSLAHVKALKNQFWADAAELAPRLEIRDRAELLSLIWGDVAPFTELYVRLFQALAKLGFARDACCGLEGLTDEKNGERVRRTDSIINVDTLFSLGADNAASGTVTLENVRTGQSAALQRGEATALIAELGIQMDDKPYDFFEHTDLLDFPGARSREPIQKFESWLQEGETRIGTVFLRGKVAYLYERYNAERELTSMLLCVGPSNQEVTSLPSMIQDWIHATHGQTVAERAEQETALFLVLTKFDMHFDVKGGNVDDYTSRWTNRLDASFRNFFGKQFDWPYHWQGNNQPFRNIFWVRNPNFRAEAIIDYDADGQEIQIRDTAAERIERLHQGYLENPDVQSYIAEPDTKWDAAMTMNDGGVSLLAERLRPVCRPELKLNQIAGRIREVQNKLHHRLAPYHISGDYEAELAKRLERIDEDVVPPLVDCMQEGRFGLLLREAMVDEYDMERLFKSVRFRKPVDGSGKDGGKTEEAAASAPSRGASPATGTGRLAKIRRGAGAKPADAAPADGGDTSVKSKLKRREDPGRAFASEVLRAWTTALRTLQENDQRTAYFHFNPGGIETLVNELVAGAERMGLADEVAQKVSHWETFTQEPHQAAPGAGLIAGNIVNDYITYLGFDRQDPDARPSSDPDDPNNDRPIFPPHGAAEAEVERIELAEVPEPYNEDYCADWLIALQQLTRENVSGGVDADTPQNRRLGEILANLGDQAA